METSELLEAGSDLGVESLQSRSMKAGRHGSDGEHHFTEGGAVTKQLQGHLGVRQFPKSL
jgi:hypothetical protein